MAIEKSGSATWSGDLKSGKGALSAQSGTLKDAAYTFATRFEGKAGTNPEELIGAAHASCFAMAFSNILSEAGHLPDEVAATSTVTLEMLDGGPTVTKIHLDVTAKVPGIDDITFQAKAAEAKAGCPISRLLAAAEITMDATLS
ncbi:OsmC family peroxiredoxin [Rhodobacterales bacterium HKCCE2091]|nr:OsmC family peroxiredoxin [Rhodobacterales bacterium HKCCE2091]